MQWSLCRGCCSWWHALLLRSSSIAQRMAEAAQSGYLNAMAAATYLVHKGVPFRTAHEKIGNAVRFALKNGVELGDLTLNELRAVWRRVRRGFFCFHRVAEDDRLPRCDGRNSARARARGALQRQSERIAEH